MSLLILSKSIHVCYMINPWFTKLVGSRWLVVMPVLFCLAVFLVLFLPIYAPWAIRMRKKKKKLSQCPAILSSRLANHAYRLSFFKDSNNVVQAFSSLRAFTPVKFRFSCTKIMHTNEIDSAPKLIWKTFTTKKKKSQRTDKFDPLRDKNKISNELLLEVPFLNGRPWYPVPRRAPPLAQFYSCHT